MPSQKRLIILFLAIAVISGIALSANHYNKAQQLSAEMTTRTTIMHHKKAHKTVGSTSNPEAIPQPTNSPSTHTTVTTSGNCTKTETSKTSQAGSGSTYT